MEDLKKPIAAFKEAIRMRKLIVLTVVAFLAVACATTAKPLTPSQTEVAAANSPAATMIPTTSLQKPVLSTAEVASDEPSLLTPTATGAPSPTQASLPRSTSAPPSPTPLAESILTTTPQLTASTEHSPTSGPHPFPALLAEIPLAPEEEELTDLLVDPTGSHIYATDSASQLHVLDATDFTRLITLPAAGQLTLDTQHGLLFISPRDGSPLTLVDTVALTVTGTISPGGAVAVDPTRRRFYVGQDEANTTVRAYDLSSLEQVGEITQPGQPIYNPLRDELYLQYLNLYIASPDTLTVTGKVLPDLAAEQYGWCEGCTLPDGALVDPERNILAVDIRTISAKGPGLYPSPYFYDATTLEELTDLAQQPGLEEGCFGQLVLAEPVGGQVYREKRYRYENKYDVNLLVYDTVGNLVDWYSGVSLGQTNPRTKQMYSGARVYNLAPFTPLAWLPAPVDCFGPIDAATGRLYAVKGNRLLVFAEEGGEPFAPPLQETGPYPEGASVGALHFSPGYAQDQTVFMINGNPYRSQNGGQTWVELPVFGDELALSPDFATDQTLFIFGSRAYPSTIYRSTDGGDTWQPIWNGLRHLNIFNLSVSPDFTTDNSLFAFARYLDLTGTGSLGTQQLALYRSTDRGNTWTQVVTGDFDERYWLALSDQSPSARVLFQTGKITGPFVVERSRDFGGSWEIVFTPPEDSLFPGYRSPFAFSPNLAADHTLFLYSDDTIFRTTDNGDTWQQVFFIPQDESYNKLEAVSLSPNFGQDQFAYAHTGSDLFRSTDGGADWEQVFTVDSAGGSLQRLIFSPAYATDRTMFLMAQYTLYRSADGGGRWETVLNVQSSDSFEDFSVYAPPLFSSTFSADRTMYAYSDFRLFRSIDSGSTWQQWNDERLPGPESEINLARLVVSPATADGGHQLFIGTGQRQGPAHTLYVLDPDQMDWSRSTHAPAPYATPSPTPLPEVPVEAPYALLWLEHQGRFGIIGPAVAPAIEAPYAVQLFENGLMHWGWRDGDTPYIHVLYYSRSTYPYGAAGFWERYADTWQESHSEYPCAEAQTPSGPRRGFGEVWCTCEECRERLGPPLGEEEGYAGGYQTFEKAVMLWHRADDVVFWLRDDGYWSRNERMD